MTKLTCGVLLVLAAAAPISASVIASPSANDVLLDPTTFWTPDQDGSLVTSITSTGELTVNPGPDEAAVWYEGVDDFGPPTNYAIALPADGGGNYLLDSLTLGFSGPNPVTEFGLDAIPNDAGTPYTITASFFASTDGSGSALATITESITSSCCGGANDSENEGWYFFGYKGSATNPIGSVTVTTNDVGSCNPEGDCSTSPFGGMVLSNMEYSVVPEPSTCLFIAAGLFGLGLVSRRRLAR